MQRTLPSRLSLALSLALLLGPPAPGRAEEAAPIPAAGAAAPPAATAAADPAPKSRKELLEERKKRAMKPRTTRAFSRARQHLDAERWDDAQAALDRLRLDKLTPFERAQALRLHAYVEYGRQDNDAAIARLRAALTEPDALPPQDRADALFQIAQIQGGERRWRDALSTLDEWFATVERPNSVGYFLQALCHYQLEEMDAALLPAKKAVALAGKPQQAWLQLLLAIELTRKDYPASRQILEQLIALYPNVAKDYWLQLSALYGVTDDEARALATLELAHHKGILEDDRDLRRMLQMMLARGIPYRAATLFEQARANQRFQADAEALELQSIAWILARETEKAKEPLQRAAELAHKGELYVRLAQLHLMQEEWEDAVAALRKGLAKGGLGDPGTAQLLLGIAYYNEHRLAEARSAFSVAERSAGTREQAQSWLEHIDRELSQETAS